MRSLLPTRLMAALGLSDGEVMRRGVSIIMAEGTRTSPNYGQLDNGPDQIPNLVLPAGGLIICAAQMQMKSSAASAGSAAYFLNTNQATIQNTNSRAAIGQSVLSQGTVYNSIASGDPGLVTTNQTTADIAADVAFGQLVGVQLTTRFAGGFDLFFADAGVYTLSVQWKATSGSVSARYRRLWAMAVGFNA